MQKYKVYINKERKIIIDNWDDFCKGYNLIQAAGGVVYNDKDQVLMIFRNEKWDLPKGKLEDGENIQQCAIREVEEECGIGNLKITDRLPSTYHVYEMNNKSMLKHTYWFRMKTDFTSKLVPQIEEGITKVEWVSKKDMFKKIENTYASIKELLLNE